MSVGSAGKWLALGLLVTALGATGCKDDDDDDNGGNDASTQDSGAKDAGNGEKDSGASDAGKTDTGAGDAAAEGCPGNPGTNNACCGADKKTLCTFHMTGLGPTKAGCAVSESDAEVCGISSENVLGPDAAVPFFEKNAPGVASQSCADFYDKLEQADAGATPGNGLIDSTRMIGGLTIKLAYPGCCTAAGYCSIDGKMGTADIGSGANPADNGYGCMKSIYAFRTSPEVGPAGTPIAGLPLRQMPCDPQTGMIKIPSVDAGATDGGTDGGASDAGASDAGADGGNG